MTHYPNDASEQASYLLSVFDDDGEALLLWFEETDFDEIDPDNRQDVAYCYGYFYGVASMLCASGEPMTTEEVLRDILEEIENEED